MAISFNTSALWMNVWHYASLEEECHKSLGISLFLLQLFFHSLYCHLEEEADEVLVRSFRTNRTEGRNVFLSGFGWDDEERMIQS